MRWMSVQLCNLNHIRRILNGLYAFCLSIFSIDIHNNVTILRCRGFIDIKTRFENF